MVGTITVIPIWYRSMAAMTFSASKPGSTTDGTPKAGAPMMPSIDAPWNMGVWMRKGHSRTQGRAMAMWYWLSTSARCDSTTPFGWPVVPPVYMRTAGSSSSGSAGTSGVPAASSFS